MRTMIILSAMCVLLAAGCEPQKTANSKKLLKLQNKELERQLAAAEKQITGLEEQLTVTNDLGQQVREANLNNVKKIKIARFTNIYDKDKDGRPETLIVYLQLVDEDSDVIKAPADVKVELWDLNSDIQPKLAEWHIKPGDLNKLWSGGILGSSYRLTFDVKDKISVYDGPLVIKVQVTDYLTGREFDLQKTIEPLD